MKININDLWIQKEMRINADQSELEIDIAGNKTIRCKILEVRESNTLSNKGKE